MRNGCVAFQIRQALRFLALALFAALLIPAATASAQTYPARSVRLVVPSSPGGGIDLVARIIAARLSDIWGQAVVVENKPGANFIIGTDHVAKAAPDGYTLLYVPSPALTVNPAVFADLPYDPQRDLLPISVLSRSPFVLLVNNAVPANSVQELLALLRAKPGKFNMGSSSASTRLVSELFKSLAKVDYAEISYKGGAQSANSTVSGETEMSFVDVGSAVSLLRAGRVRAFAVTTTQRYKPQPEIPTLAEAGVPGFSSAGLTVLAAPSKTPPEIVRKINADISRVLAIPELTQRFEAVGNEVIGSSPEEAVAIIREDTERWARLVKERNVRLR